MKIKLLIVMFLLIIPFSLATDNIQSHNVTEIYPEMFTWGNYTFPANVTINDTLFADFLKGNGTGLTDLNRSIIIYELENNRSVNVAFEQNITIKDTVLSKDINLTGNLTLGDKIIFKLGEFIDNLVDGWIRINGNLNVTKSVVVTENLTVRGNTTLGSKTDGYLHVGGYDSFSLKPGDIFSTGHIMGNASITSTARPFGIGLMASNSNQGINFTSTGGTADMDTTNAVICDSTDPWLDGNYAKEGGHEKMYLTVLSSSPTDYRGATGEILDVINSTCVRISVAAAGKRSMGEITTMTYVVYKPPIFVTLDRGNTHLNVGRNEDAKFHVYIPDGRGFYGMFIDDNAGTDQHQALTIEQDGYNHDGIVGLNVKTFSSIPVDNKLGINTLLEIDGTGVSNSEGRFIDMRLIGQPTNSETDGIHMDANIHHIIHIGSEDILSSAYYYNITGTFNITANVKSESLDQELFTEDNDVLYIGNELNFTTLSFSLDTKSSANILPFYYYCAKNGTWMPLIGVVDTTAGFTTSGSISFTNPNDRGVCNATMDGDPMDVTNYTYVAINRTRNFIVTPPIENVLGISGATDYFLLQKDMIKLQPVTAPPETCGASMEGATYYDIDLHLECCCTGTNWVQKDDWSTVCS